MASMVLDPSRWLPLGRMERRRTERGGRGLGAWSSILFITQVRRPECLCGPASADSHAGEVIRSWEGSLYEWDQCPHRPEKDDLSLETAGSQTSTNQEEGPQRETNTLFPSFPVSRIVRNFHCLSCPVYGILSEQPKLTKPTDILN